MQPASLDLRLGEMAYRIRCSFLPDRETVEAKVKDYIVDELDLHERRRGARDEPAVPHPADRGASPCRRRCAGGQPEELDRPARRVHPGDHRRELPLRRDRAGLPRAGCTSRSCRCRSPCGCSEAVAQPAAPRRSGARALDDDELRALHAERRRSCSARRAGRRPTSSRTATACSSASTSTATPTAGSATAAREQRPAARPRPGRRATSPTSTGSRSVARTATASCSARSGSTCCCRTRRRRSRPTLAAEMTAYDPTSGELRTHYAGFFDPGLRLRPGRRSPRVTRGARGARPRRAVHDRARPAGLQAHLRADARGAREALRARHRLELPGSGRDARQALPASQRIDEPGSWNANHRRIRLNRPCSRNRHGTTGPV